MITVVIMINLTPEVITILIILLPTTLLHRCARILSMCDRCERVVHMYGRCQRNASLLNIRRTNRQMTSHRVKKGALPPTAIHGGRSPRPFTHVLLKGKHPGLILTLRVRPPLANAGPWLRFGRRDIPSTRNAALRVGVPLLI